MVVVAGSGQYTTFVARMLLLPVTLAGGAKDSWPLMVINPSLECIQLERADDGRWHVSPDRSLVQAGLVRPGPRLPLGVPADGLIARLTGSAVAVVLQAPPFTVYEAPADDQLLGQARALGGVLFAVTPTLNPGDLDTGELPPALADPRTLAGWAALHAPARQRRRRFRLRPQIWVLHWNLAHLSIGRLIRLAPRKLTDDQAQSWAERILSRGAPLEWQPVQEHSLEEGWQVRDLASGLQYVIRRHADGWKLVGSAGRPRGSGPRPTTRPKPGPPES